MYQSTAFPSAPWYNDEAPRRDRNITAPVAMPVLSSIPRPIDLSSGQKLLPRRSVPQTPLNDTLPTLLGKKRELETETTAATLLSPPAEVPRPTLQEFTSFIVQFVKAHNQGNIAQIKDHLKTRFHSRFERVSYRVEMPSGKALENTKIQSFGIDSYMKYLHKLSKHIPDSVFLAGRPFTMKNYAKKRSLYIVQCNYSFRGTYLLTPNDDSVHALLNDEALQALVSQQQQQQQQPVAMDLSAKSDDSYAEHASVCSAESVAGAEDDVSFEDDLGDIDFSLFFGENELTGLDYVSLDEVDGAVTQEFASERNPPVEDVFLPLPASNGIASGAAQQEHEEKQSHSNANGAAASTQVSMVNVTTQQFNSVASVVLSGTPASPFIASVPFNLNGKMTLYVNKRTQKVVRLEYMYS